MTATDHHYLQMAARLALRGHGGAEPNPLVGCVIVSRDDDVVGWGYHRRCGGAHAEIEALRRAGARAAGSTVYVTLEPCNHTGRTGPCSEALIEARVGRVVFARSDPTQDAAGGARRLGEAGVEVERIVDCRAATAVSDPYVHRVRSGLPWVVVKWAQTIDGGITTRAGEPRWISNEASRRLVHLERGRCDAILTGIGTVRADDPLLSARGRRRRVPLRVVVDPTLEIPLDRRLVTTAADVSTIVACRRGALEGRRAAALRDAGVKLLGFGSTGSQMKLAPILSRLVSQFQVTNVLVEAGPGLLRRLFAESLVNEAWAFIAPRARGDAETLPDIGAATLELLHVRRRGDDVILRYRVRPKSAEASGS